MAATLRLPLEVSATGSLRALEQDTPAELAQSVRTLLSTVIGERGALPDYGLIDQLGAVDVDASEIAHAIAEWEPRIQEPQTTMIASTLADGAALTTINVVI